MTFTITQPPALLVSATATPVSCFGGANGTVTSIASGGTPGYTYLWSNGTTTANLTAVAAGTYTVTVRDANNCSATASATVTQPATALTASATATATSKPPNSSMLNPARQGLIVV